MFFWYGNLSNLENDKNINKDPIYQYSVAEIWIHNLLISSEPFFFFFWGGGGILDNSESTTWKRVSRGVILP